MSRDFEVMGRYRYFCGFTASLLFLAGQNKKTRSKNCDAPRPSLATQLLGKVNSVCVLFVQLLVGEGGGEEEKAL